MEENLRKFSKEELEEILKEHKFWLESEGKEGQRADLSRVILSGADLSRARLRGVNLNGARLSGTDLHQASLHEANLENADLGGSDLSQADLGKANIIGANLSGADLSEANLFKANLYGADLVGAKLDKANLGSANLVNADLSGAKLNKAILSEADLSGADLIEADLFGAQLNLAKLSHASLFKALLLQSNLSGANLSGANLNEVYLMEADLRMTVLHKVTLKEAVIFNTKVYRRADLALAENIFDYSGFVFSEEDEDRVRKERGERDKKAKDDFDATEKGMITFSLPDTYSPAQIGRLLFLLSFLYEGVRFALLTPFEDIDDLFGKSMAPELYGAHQDKYSLRLASLQQGSWVGAVEGIFALLGIIQALPAIYKQWRTGKSDAELHQQEINTAEKAAAYYENRENTLITQVRSLTSLARTPGMPTDLMEDIYTVIRKKVGTIDRYQERIPIAAQVRDHTIGHLTAMRDSLGGEFKILGQDLLPERREERDLDS